jgi:hypothetical protein
MFKDCPSQASYLKSRAIIAPIGKDFQYFFSFSETKRMTVSLPLHHPAHEIFDRLE